jgi:hypothetical protein
MDTLIGAPMGSVIDRFQDWTGGAGAGASRVVHPSGFTSLDIETDALVRLARKGYDWSARWEDEGEKDEGHYEAGSPHSTGRPAEE